MTEWNGKQDETGLGGQPTAGSASDGPNPAATPAAKPRKKIMVKDADDPQLALL